MHSRHPIVAPLHCLLGFAQAVKVKSILFENTLDPAQSFWHYTTGIMTDIAVIEWCKVFGSWEEDTHWTKAIPEERHDGVRSALLAAINMDGQGWEGYHASILDYRNQIAAHTDLDARVEKYPVFETALVAAYFMYAQLLERLDEEKRGGLPTSLERWSDTVAKNMKPIIVNAFEGSAKLGSNLPH